MGAEGAEQGSQGQTQAAVWEEQLKESLKAAYDVSAPWDADVHDVIFEDRSATYKKNSHMYAARRKRILDAATVAGKVARVCADHESRVNVSVQDLQAGIAAAAKVCRAGLRGTPPEVFLFWCE